jgi:hypothetical protein
VIACLTEFSSIEQALALQDEADKEDKGSLLPSTSFTEAKTSLASEKLGSKTKRRNTLMVD